MDKDDLLQQARDIVRKQAGRARLAPDVADDLTQELVVKYLKAWPGDSAPDNPAAWLQRAGSNVVADHFRQDHRKPQNLFGIDDGDPVAALVATMRAARTPSLAVVGNSVWQAALGLVPSEHANVLRRRFLDGVPAADLGEELGISRAAVDQRTARAKARMREALAKRPDLVDALQSAHQHAYPSDNRFR